MNRRIARCAAIFLFAASVVVAEEPTVAWLPVVGAKLTVPQIASGTIGVGRFGPAPEGAWWPFVRAGGWGPFVALEPGISGIKYDIGYGGMSGPASAAAKVALLRTYGSPIGCEASQTYLGVEVSMLVFSLGAYGHVSGDDNGHAVILSAGIGFGF
jgi:hypothetical protein